MATMSKKILVKLWEPAIKALREKTDAACMKRDAYLDKVLRREAENLRAEVSSRNSDEARDHIARELGMLGSTLKPTNLLLAEETVTLIAAACDERNIPRDAFVNRVILFLVVRPSFFRSVYSEIDWEWAREAFMDKYIHDEKFLLFTPSMLNAIGEIMTLDPFWYVRECIGVARESDPTVPLLHDKFIPRDALGKLARTSIGFNCYVADILVDGHPAARAFTEETRRQLDELVNDSSDRTKVS